LSASKSKGPKITYVIGTRPEIIRSATVIAALEADPAVSFKLVHTGQHYDFLMDRVFFKELAVPKPDINIAVGSGTHAEQTAAMMVGMERYFERTRPDLVGVFGDTNSSLAATLAAVKLEIPVAHLEAGCREYEMDMPEEINRRVIDHCSRLLFPVADVDAGHLSDEKVLGAVHNVGDPLYDVFKACRKKAASMRMWERLGVEKGKYALVTLHRPANVDDEATFDVILKALSSREDLSVVFPVHPRTRPRLESHKRHLKNFILAEPFSYHEILSALSGASFVVTDSGGLQKEAFWSRVPCVTVREHSGWYDLVDFGVNILTGKRPKGVQDALRYVMENRSELKNRFKGLPNPYYRRDTAKRMVGLMKRYSSEGW
jgi:UDP-N-acetylglucosamine 2-epimerase